MQFAAGFEEVPLAPTASKKLVDLGEVMKKPDWAGAHDAAHDALTGAKKLVAEGSELADHAYSVESIFNARAPNVDTVKGIKHPVLQEALKPLTTYLEKFGAFIMGWAGLSPPRMRPKGEEDAITPAAYRMSSAYNASRGTDHVHGPDCGHDYAPSASSGGGHVHGPDCGHDHSNSGTPARGGGHYHADGSYHEGPHKPHLPKGKSSAGWWVAGIVAAVGVGVYLINEYGKPKKKEYTPTSGDWKGRIEQTAASEARIL